MKKDSLWHNKTLIAVCVEAVLLMMGMGQLSPAIPIFVEALGVEQAQIGLVVGLVVAAYGMARAIMDVPAGTLARRWGRRPLLIIGPALAAISAVGCGLAGEYWHLITFLVLEGLGLALFSVAAMIVIGEISTVSNRGKYMSLFWGASLVGLSLGATVGGIVGEHLGCRVAFFCFAGLALLAALWGWFRILETKNVRPSIIPETSSNPPAKMAAAKALSPLYLNSNFILICAVSLFTLIVVGGNQITLVPLLGYERLSLTEEQVGLSVTLTLAVQCAFVFLAGWLSDKLGRKALIVPGGIVTGLGLMMFTQSAGYWLLLLSAMVLGVGRGFGGPIRTAYVAEIASGQNYEHAMAVHRSASDAGFVVGPILLGWFADDYGLDFPFFLGAGLLIAAVICFSALARETGGRSKGHHN